MGQRLSIGGSIVVALALLGAIAGVASGEVRFVRTNGPVNGNGQTWGSAYRTLTAALDEAGVNPAITQVWVAAGVYKPHASDRDASFTLVSNVAVFGGFAGTESLLAQRNPTSNITVLSGDLAGNDGPGLSGRDENSRHVVRAAGISNARLDGFTVRSGNADHPGSALMGGGGIYLLQSSVVVERCTLSSNIAGGTAPALGGFGGGMLVRACPNVQVLDCVFQANRGMNGGGLAIWHQDESGVGRDTTVLVQDTDFFGNFSPAQSGGAMRVHAGDPLGNTAQGDVTIRNGVFEDNSAEYDGAIQEINTTRMVIEGCRFFSSRSLVSGGAIGTIQTVGGDVLQPLLIDRCEFDFNTVGPTGFGGAGVYAQARAVIIRSSTFTRHQGTSVVRSGPVTGIAGGGRPLVVHNARFNDNPATAIHVTSSPSVEVVSSTIARNVSGTLAGGIEANAAQVRVANTILWENRRGVLMDQDAQLRSTFAAPIVDFSVVQGLTPALGGTGNLGVDPRFANASFKDYRLASGSPARDAGSNPLAPVGIMLDVAGHPRLAEVAAAPNTGIGPAPIIDIGAHESAASTCVADLTHNAVAGEPGYGVPNGTLNSDDFFYYLARFGAGDAGVCDLTQTASPGQPGFGTPDGLLNSEDFFFFLNLYGAGC